MTMTATAETNNTSEVGMLAFAGLVRMTTCCRQKARQGDRDVPGDWLASWQRSVPGCRRLRNNDFSGNLLRPRNSAKPAIRRGARGCGSGEGDNTTPRTPPKGYVPKGQNTNRGAGELQPGHKTGAAVMSGVKSSTRKACTDVCRAAKGPVTARPRKTMRSV